MPTPTLSFSKEGTKWSTVIPVFVIDDTSAQAGSWTRIQISDEQFPKDELDALPGVPNWWGFNPGTPPNSAVSKKAKRPIASMMKLVNHLTWKYFGCVRKKHAVLMAPRGLVENARSHRDLSGPFNGKPLFTIRKSKSWIFVTDAVAQTIDGDVPYASTRLPTSGIALALQRAYEVFKQGMGLLKTIEELFVSLDELKLNKSILHKRMRCRCIDDIATREKAAHYCMFCLKLKICSRMVWTSDDRYICEAHLTSDAPPRDEFPIRRIRAVVLSIERPPRVRSSIPLHERHLMGDTLIDS